MELLDNFINELLHINDARANKLIDVGNLFVAGNSADGEKAFKLWREGGNEGAVMLATAAARKGKLSNRTVLENSALTKTLVNNPKVEKWLWSNLNGVSDPKKLDGFIDGVYKELNLKGNNPLFLGIGCLKWETAVADGIEAVCSPLLIFPVKLVRGTQTSNVEIEFVDDDAYFNPCLIHRLRRDLSEYVSDNFPHPNGGGADFDAPVDLNVLGDGNLYFERVEKHVKNCSGGGAFEFYRNALVIAQYNHSDMCMYYDVRRNREKIYASPLVKKVFGGGAEQEPPAQDCGADFILPADSIQQKLIKRVARGESLIVKGPPGTGKTLTIANMIAALLSQGKRVLVASKKLSALGEINAKLPERLRKFVMLLDYETERQAAAVNPEEVKKELKKIVRGRREYVYDKTVTGAYAQTAAEKTDAVFELNSYYTAAFKEGDVAGGSYFDALDTYYKNDLPAAEFVKPEEAAKISRKEYNALYAKVGTAAKHFAKMSAVTGFKKCPWAECAKLEDTEGAIGEYAGLCRLWEKTRELLKPLFNAFPNIDFSGVPVGGIAGVASGNALDRINTGKLLSCEKIPFDSGELKELLKDCVDNPLSDSVEFFEENSDKCFEGVVNCGADGTLTPAEIEFIYANRGIFYRGNTVLTEGATGEKIEEVADKICELDLKRREAELDTLAVFALSDSKETDLIKKSFGTLLPYKGAEEPKRFDFKAKGAFKKLAAISVRKNAKFKDIVGAIASYEEFLRLDGELCSLTHVLTKTFGRQLLKDELKCLFTVLAKSRLAGMTVKDYLESVKAVYPDLCACLEKCKIKRGGCDLNEFKAAVSAKLKFENLSGAVKKIAEAACLTEDISDVLSSARTFACLISFKELKEFENLAVDVCTDIIAKIKESGAEFAGCAEELSERFVNFGTKYFNNYYTRNAYALTPAELDNFAACATDRTLVGAAAEYYSVTTGENNALPLDKFFGFYERGDYDVNISAQDLFEHSFYALALEEKLARLGTMRNGLGKKVEAALDKFERAEKKEQELNVKKIESLCMSRINPDDGDFDFLDADKGFKTSLRALFKTRAAAILKLKRCLILSPSTASVLLRPEEFSEFDVAIIDEASQLEPVNLLPVLFRTRQCVMVGDEYQMPPISHFKVKNIARINNFDEELSLDTDISALSLALANNAFDTEELVCHYRSRTETLIAFSQKEFYPYMRTFPAAVPFGEGLGFKDIFVENGYCDGGVNPAEAEEVVKCVNEHFDRFFDEKTGVLAHSLGVVAFGEAQLRYILSLVAKDTKLYNRINTAKTNFDDVEEKLIFFKTIESVQGQETENLILSLTYGRDRNGALRLMFGELNRDALGKCIFNVAVTRAQSRVTVIHSVKPEEMGGNPRIAFIRDYLLLVRRFSEGGRGQFLSGVPERGEHFVKSVANFVIGCGYDKERVVINYGVTEGSVKIPVAVLSKDLQTAELGIWCEQPVMKKYDFFDYNLRYYRSLQGRGWNMYRVFAHDWTDNRRHEEEALLNALKKYVK